MRSLLYATTGREELALACARLREYYTATRERRIKKQIRLLSFVCLILFGWVAASALEKVSDTSFPGDFRDQAPSTEPLVIGRNYRETLRDTRATYVTYCGTVPSKSQLPAENPYSLGDMYIALDTGRGWLWTVPPWSRETSWVELASPLGTMPEGRLQVDHRYIATLPDNRSGVVRYKGAITSRTALPQTGNTLGDMWSDIQSGACWIWTIPLGQSIPKWIDP